MTRSKFPVHLQSNKAHCQARSVCGNFQVVMVPWRSCKRVKCQNCLAIIKRGVETKYFQPAEMEQGNG
jgi:hypothetical protein